MQAQLRTPRAEPRPDADAVGTLAAQHAAAGKSLAHLLGVLRATPRVAESELPVGVLRAHRHNVTSHRKTMTGLFFGDLVAGLFTFFPGRIMYHVVFGS